MSEYMTFSEEHCINATRNSDDDGNDGDCGDDDDNYGGGDGGDGDDDGNNGDGDCGDGRTVKMKMIPKTVEETMWRPSTPLTPECMLSII